MDNLRSKLIRLAYRKPELRSDLLPLLTKTAKTDTVYLLTLGLGQHSKGTLKTTELAQDLDVSEHELLTDIGQVLGVRLSEIEAMKINLNVSERKLRENKNDRWRQKEYAQDVAKFEPVIKKFVTVFERKAKEVNPKSKSAKVLHDLLSVV